MATKMTLPTVGIELEIVAFENNRHQDLYEQFEKFDDRGFFILKDEIHGGKFTHDGSINGEEGIEITSPILGSREELGDWVSRICGMLKGGKGVVDESCGIHVHVAAHDREASFSSILQEWVKIEDLMFEVSGNRRDNKYCQPVQKMVAEQMLCFCDDGIYIQNAKDVEKLTDSELLELLNRYTSLNVLSWKTHRTLEVRMAQGSTDPEFIYGWARVCQQILAALMAGETVSEDSLSWILQTLEQDEREWFKDRLLFGDKGEIFIPRRPRGKRNTCKASNPTIRRINASSDLMDIQSIRKQLEYAQSLLERQDLDNHDISIIKDALSSTHQRSSLVWDFVVPNESRTTYWWYDEMAKDDYSRVIAKSFATLEYREGLANKRLAKC